MTFVRIEFKTWLENEEKLQEGLLQNLTKPTIWGLIQWAQNQLGIPEGSPLDIFKN